MQRLAQRARYRHFEIAVGQVIASNAETVLRTVKHRLYSLILPQGPTGDEEWVVGYTHSPFAQ